MIIHVHVLCKIVIYIYVSSFFTYSNQKSSRLVQLKVRDVWEAQSPSCFKSTAGVGTGNHWVRPFCGHWWGLEEARLQIEMWLWLTPPISYSTPPQKPQSIFLDLSPKISLYINIYKLSIQSAFPESWKNKSNLPLYPHDIPMLVQFLTFLHHLKPDNVTGIPKSPFGGT